MNKFLYVAFLCITTIIVSCKKSVNTESNVNDFTEYIGVYPNKVISSVPNLRFYLNKKVAVTDIKEDVITIKPKVKGKIALDNNVLLFVPDEKLENNKEYQVVLHLDKLYADIPTNLKDFTVNVKTKPLHFNVAIKSPSIYNKNLYYVEGKIEASDVLDNSTLSNIITANYNGKAKKITFDTVDKYAKVVSFKVDSIQRLNDDKVLNVTWKGASLKSSSKGEREVTITGKSNFKVLSVDVFNDAKQRIEISFSDPIKSSQNLKGLIQFLDTQKRGFTHRIDKNVVTIYPASSHREKVDLEIFKEIKNSEGRTLKENTIHTLYFEQLKPEVNFIKSGTILPNSENLKINFKAVSLKAVDVTVYKIYKDNVLQFLQNNNLSNQANLRYVGRPEVKYTMNLSNQGLDISVPNAFSVDLKDLVTIEDGAMYRVEFTFNKEYAVYNCEESDSNNTTTIVYGKKEIEDKSYDNTRYYRGYPNEYRWRDRENPCTISYYHNKKISTNILASNLGVIVKKGNNDNMFVAVTDIITTQPVEGAIVTLLNLQQQAIITSKANAEGVAEFQKVKGAFFASVAHDGNTTYVKLNDGNALSMSKFDVSGAKLQKGIKGYIYGERGVWRPGDQLFLTFVLNDKENPIPQEHPIKFELVNPQGKIINRAVRQKNAENIYNYAPKTDQDDLTGNWNVNVQVGAARFNKTLKIETIKPNRLKMKFNSNADLVKYGESISGNLEVKWLHGAIARNLGYDINGRFSSTITKFPSFLNYHFDDITRRTLSETFTIAEGKLNGEGKTDYRLPISKGMKTPGMLKATLITKVYENGGDFSTDVFSTKISPYGSYVGINMPEEQQSKNFLFTDQEYAFNVASVDQEGKGFASNLEVKVYKLSWRWWWNSSNDGVSNYDGSTYHSTYKEMGVSTTNNGKGSFKLKIDKNDWGRFLVKVKDKNSGHVTSSIVYFDWPSWYGKKRGSQDKTNATMLSFSSDKSAYNVDENVTIKFPSSQGGRALITIENGTEVLDYFWSNTKEKSTEFSFPVLENYTPNIFVNVSLLQKHAQTENDLPIRLYGSIPILVSDPKTKLQPEIQLAEEIKPETTATIKVNEKDGKPMTYTIALVDEGLLDLTRFKTPNPWNTFYTRQSLGVKTWDIFDDVIGAYGGKANQILSIGGDEAEAGSKNKKANRFKPMVTYMGPFKLASGETKAHQIKIPNYVGSVRAMVVASDTNNEAYGSAEKTAFVRKPIMVLASLPRKITPQETVTLPITVFAMKKNIKNVKVIVKPNESYTIQGNESQTISFDQPDEKMAYFTLKVNDYKGIGKVRIEASSGSEKAFYEVEIDVLNPNPVTTEVKDLVLKSNEQSEINFATFGTLGTNTASIELSTLPPMNFTKRMEYLIRYPHGCVEQTTSSAFPQLFLSQLFELTQDKKSSIERNIKATIQRLSNFQISNGGLSYWQGGNRANAWGTSYAGHFMIEASKKGYSLPIGFKSKWIAYQKQQARTWRNTSQYSNNALTQAYRLYTLSLVNKPDLASMNRLREMNNLSDEVKKRLASAYALIGKKSIAKSILNSLGAETYTKRRYYYNYGSVIRDKAMSLETYTLLDEEVKAIKLAKEIAERLSSKEWMSTQTTSYGLLAMAKYSIKNGENSGIKASYALNKSKGEANTSKSLFISDLSNVYKQNTFTINNTSNGVLYVRLFNKGILPVGEEKTIQKNLEVYVNYFTKEGKKLDPKTLSQGTNFVAEITIGNTTSEDVENIALTQFIPSGWEIVNTRFTDFGSSTTSSNVDYTDIRDASISNYFTLKEYKNKKFRVLLNASYLGDYYLPGVQAEAMYDNDYIARTKGEWIKVVK